MTSGLVLAIDQGTTNTKALAFDDAGKVVASASTPMAVSYPRPGWAEQSGLDIWASVQRVVENLTRQVGADIDALAISNQRETIVVWDAETGQPIAPAILWQCRRTADECAALRANGYAETILARTGLDLDPLFPAAKIAWILDHTDGARDAAEAGRLRAGTVDCWLLWQLSGGRVHATDTSNASRTQLFNIDTLRWDKELAGIFRVPLSLLPDVRPSQSLFGQTADKTTELRTGIPIHAMLGDSHAALYGQGIREPGAVKATYGTGSSLMTLTDARIASRHGLSSTVAWSTRDGPVYALEGNISVSGQAAAFMAELLGLTDATELAHLAATVPDSNGISFVPALVGLGAPHWAPDARGLISGLALGSTRAHLARATIEAIAFQVADVFAAMEADLGQRLDTLAADGGASRNDMLMQFQADIIDRTVVRSDVAEASASGAAMLARSAVSGSSLRPSRDVTQFSPTISAADRSRLTRRWHTAVERSLAHVAMPEHHSDTQTE